MRMLVVAGLVKERTLGYSAGLDVCMKCCR